ncbi:hypothetical protein KBZ15_03805 [Cyanobium sp. BA20m-p-22]|uniref:hypothetical protein n=1 Tax=Cyanobium sp. BA20m-p-22 TaxID=2823704 RepID=UPI0020CF3070|nr:hypothetical protein [Cyanobium sp. BA20m-p-22]MCP9909042.1 hypothetical protein [Cyanobium sp. BA20m-p-22]
MDRRHGKGEAFLRRAKDPATDGRTKAIIKIKAILIAAPTTLRERPEPLHYGA